MAKALIRMLGLPIMGYTAPQTIQHGNEPPGYKLGCKNNGGVPPVSHDQSGYETYSSLYTISSCCATCALDFHTQCLPEYAPMLGTNVYGEHYYQDGAGVQAYYNCNMKVNEANIPYISGELVAYGKLACGTLPTAHIPSDKHWTCITKRDQGNEWSRLYTTTDISYICDNADTLCVTGTTKLINTTNYASIYSNSVPTPIACQALFGGSDPTDGTAGFLLMAKFDTNSIDSYDSSSNQINLTTQPTNSQNVLTPNDGEFLATYYKADSDYYITGIYPYNANTNSLGENVYDFGEDATCRKLVKYTIDTIVDTATPTSCCYVLTSSWHEVGNKCKTDKPIYIHINSGVPSSLSSTTEAFIDHVEFSHATVGSTDHKYLDFYNSSGTKLYSIDATSFITQASSSVVVCCWNVSAKVDLTNVRSCMNITT